MFYASIDDLPLHCLINLPEEAQHVYRNAFNRAWRSVQDFRVAQNQAWTEVREKFEKDGLSGRWIRRAPANALRPSAFALRSASKGERRRAKGNGR